MVKPENCCGHVISSSHWDREWYHTVERSRFRLARCLDRLLDLLEHDPAWHFFHTDGQVQMLLDYLEVRPEARDRIIRLNRAGKLGIGPFLVQPDEQMPHGEVVIRNLEFGLADAAELGGAEKFGYLADNFGHPGQFPQILSGFGIDGASFWRGYDENQVEALENRWLGVDGSELLAFLMPRSYTIAANYGPTPEDDHRLELHLPKLLELSRTGNLALNDCIDHSLPPRHLAAVLEEMRARLGFREIRQSSWPELLAAVRQSGAELPVLCGELLYTPGLDSTFSTRVHQKQLAFRSELELLSYAEPLAALAALHTSRSPYREFLRRAWRNVVKNSTHDSLGGAHTDAVARDVDQRYLRALELAEGVIREALNDLAGVRGDYAFAETPDSLLVYNPLPRPLRRSFEFTFVTPNLDCGDRFAPIFRSARLFDGDRELPLVVEEIKPDFNVRFFDRLNPVIHHAFAWRAFAADVALPPLGVKTLRLEYYTPKGQHAILNADPAAPRRVRTVPPPIATPDGVLENRLLRVEVAADGTFSLLDKTSGRRYPALNLLIDQQDNGTQYGFETPPGAAERRIAAGTIGCSGNSHLRGTVVVQTTIDCFAELPAQPDFLIRRLGAEPETVRCPVTLRFTLEVESPLLAVAVAIDQRGSGHRLRTRFPVLPPGARLWAGSVFDLVERRAEDDPAHPCGVTAQQRAERTSAGFQRYLAVSSGGHGLIWAARGLYEYRAHRDLGTLELTLLRSNSTINYDFDAYGSAAGGLERGEHTLEFALLPFVGTEPAPEALARAEAYLLPPLARQFPAAAATAEFSGFELRGEQLYLSSFRPLSDRLFELRFWHQGAKPGLARLHFATEWEQIDRVRPDGTVLDTPERCGDELILTVRPREIVTLRLRRAPEPVQA